MKFLDHQKRMSALLQTIPKGRVTTYKALAEAMGFKAYRLVGQLLNKNPDPDNVPCYKVVKSDGTLGGFALGCEDKVRRLKDDGITVKDDKVSKFEQIFYSFK